MRRLQLRYFILFLTFCATCGLVNLALGPAYIQTRQSLAAALRIDAFRPKHGLRSENHGFAQDPRHALASDLRMNKTLPGWDGKMRWSIMHANVWTDPDLVEKEQEGDEPTPSFLEIAAMVEDTSLPKPNLAHQIFVPDLKKIVLASACRFEGSSETTTAVLTWQMPWAPWALRMRCRIPRDATLPGSIYVDLHLDHGDEKTEAVSISTQRIDIERKEIPYEESPLALCMAPLFGKVDMLRLLEWRFHHASLGVKTVHWYDRDGRPEIVKLVQDLNRKEGLQDTYSHAPPMSPETYDKDILLERGLYADQVLYYIDCLERSKHTAPSRWLAFIDIDEYFLPADPFDAAHGLTGWLSSINDTLATVCIDRNSYARGFGSPEQLAAEKAEGHDVGQKESVFALEELRNVVARQAVHQEDNRKCLHRTDRIIVPFVHWGILHRGGKPDSSLVVNTEDGSPRLVHYSTRFHDDRSYLPFNRTVAFKEHLLKVQAAVKRHTAI